MSFLSVLSEVWPLALAAAISPSITAICFALYRGPNGRARVLAFWAGAILGLLAWVLIISSFMWRIIQEINGHLETAAHDLDRYGRLVDLIVGVLLILFGVYRLVKRDKPKEEEEKSPIRSWISGLGDGPLREQVAFGAIMQGRNVTSVLMFVAAQQIILSAEMFNAQKLLITLLVIFVATASSWMVLITPERWTNKASGWLTPGITWMTRNARYIEVTVTFALAAYLLIRVFTH